ncbi:hypothetical protein [Fodinicola acaciae]|uniref:hypothetical protein n=1 Tax=Fodinicola acaciae TaxID=2681555 RepID=UPI0013D04500|nr:hypothetical protein [Fodinicola acaciae]
MEIAGNPNEANTAGQNTQSAADAASGVRGQFTGAAQACADAAKEASLPAAYGGYQSHFIDRINAVLTLAQNSGINIQTGAAALVQTDHDAGSGFGQAQASIPPINRGPVHAN